MKTIKRCTLFNVPLSTGRVLLLEIRAFSQSCGISIPVSSGDTKSDDSRLEISALLETSCNNVGFLSVAVILSHEASIPSFLDGMLANTI